MQRRFELSGPTLRWLVIGAIVSRQPQTRGDDLSYLVDDTCNRLHKFLTSFGSEGLDGSASDLQCVICLEVRALLGRPVEGDDVQIFW